MLITRKKTLIPSKRSSQGLDDTSLTLEKKVLNNFY